MKNNLSHATFIIPFRAENQDRINNLKTVVNHLLKYFDTNIIIAESGPENNKNTIWQEHWGGSVDYIYHHETRDFFHKTKLLNIMTAHASTEWIVSQDADCVVPPDNMNKCFAEMGKQQFKFGYPFNRGTLNLKDGKKRHFEETLDIAIVDVVNETKQLLDHHRHGNVACPPGGMFIYNKEAFLEIGGENEAFVNYSVEDAERLCRLKAMGKGIYYEDGLLYHLDHQKSNTSSWQNPHYAGNYALWDQHLKNYNRERYQEYIEKELIPVIRAYY